MSTAATQPQWSFQNLGPSIQDLFERIVVKFILLFCGKRGSDGDADHIPDYAVYFIWNTTICLFWVGFYGCVTALLWDTPLALVGFYLMVSCGYMGWFIVTTALAQNGLVYYLPRGFQKMLLQTTMLDFLTDTTFADSMKPYLPFLLGLSRRERAEALSHLPPAEAVRLTVPGLMHMLPPQAQGVLLGKHYSDSALVSVHSVSGEGEEEAVSSTDPAISSQLNGSETSPMLTNGRLAINGDGGGGGGFHAENISEASPTSPLGGMGGEGGGGGDGSESREVEGGGGEGGGEVYN